MYLIGNYIILFYRHEIAEDAGMIAHSFGEEEVDRYIMVFKKETPPSEDELNALRNGQQWSDEIAKSLQAQVCITFVQNILVQKLVTI